MHLNKGLNPKIHVLSIDPGTANLGLSFITWNGNDYKDDNNYIIEWTCHCNLSLSSKKNIERSTNCGSLIDDYYKPIDLSKNAIINTVLKKYPSHSKNDKLNEQLNNLATFLTTNSNIQRIIRKPNVFICIEQQEGVRNINILFRLMRVNMISGFISSFFKEKGMQIIFVSKTYKHGWSEINRIAKTPIKSTRVSKIRDYRKKTMCDYVRAYVMGNKNTSNAMKDGISNCPNKKLEHIADSTSQGIRILKHVTHLLIDKTDSYKDKLSKTLVHLLETQQQQ